MNNHNITPNEDFYQYVNHKWLNDINNKIPDDYSSWGGFTKLYDDGLYKQIDIIKEISNKSINDLTPDELKVLSIWNASEIRFKKWNTNNDNLNYILREINHLHETLSNITTPQDYIQKIATYLYYTQINGINNLIDFDKGSNLDNIEQVVLDISVGGLSLPSSEYYLDNKFKDKIELYKTHLTNIKTILETHTQIKLGVNFVNRVIEYETNIAKYMMKPEQSREYDKYYTNTNLEDLYLNINQLRSLESKKENYPDNDKEYLIQDDKTKELIKLFFERLYTLFQFRERLSTNLETNFKNDEDKPNKYHITAYDGDGIRRCLRLLLDMDNIESYKSYLSYKIISKYSGYCSKELDTEYFNFYQRQLGGQEKQKPEEKRNIGVVNAFGGELLGKLFVTKYFSENSKIEVQKMIDNVLDTMKTSLTNNDWLTPETKEKALLKLSKFRYKIGFPDVWKDYSKLDIKLDDDLYTISKKYNEWSLYEIFYHKLNSKIDREEWHMTPQTVNAYFSPTQNEIVFPAAILQPPFYHTQLDTVDFDIKEELEYLYNNNDNNKNEINQEYILKSINYGGIGAVIAHEITHGYDDKGRKFDENGNLNDWWNEKDTELFKQKCDLMTKSVLNYKYIDEEQKEYKMKPELTMGENLADIGGMSLSIKALLTELNQLKLNDNEICVCLRIFFKSWANIWKQNISKERRIMLLNVDPHAPTDFRGNLVQHIDKFYDVFNIKEDDNMYLSPEYRMNMW